MTKEKPNIAVFVDMLGGYGRDVLRGIANYVRSHDPWTFFGDPERAVAPIRDLRHWTGDGIIAQAYTRDLRTLLGRARMPVVNVSQRLAPSSTPSVLTDDQAIGRIGARHFLDRGFVNFGYSGFARHHYSVRRGEAFRATVEAAGGSCSMHQSAAGRQTGEEWEKSQRELKAWIASLPRPVAVMGCNDVKARHIAQACLEMGLRIPEELALLGCDNDELICELSSPPLSSINLYADRIGFAAAALLQRLMAGEKPPESPVTIPPGEVVVRQSSDVLAIDDTDVAGAIRFIREHSARNISVDDVVQTVLCGRRQLERRFFRVLHRTIGEELVLSRLDRACKLLRETDLTIAEVALRSGYNHVQQFTSTFHDRIKSTPARYRREYRMREIQRSDAP